MQFSVKGKEVEDNFFVQFILMVELLIIFKCSLVTGFCCFVIGNLKLLCISAISVI